MNKSLFIKLLIILLFSCSKETNPIQSFEFVTNEFSIDGQIYQSKSKTISTNIENIDIQFFNKNFGIPYYLPPKFVDHNYVNDTITIWDNDESKIQKKSNWSNIYIFDNESKIVSYEYSSCKICSSFPYKYIVSYNNENQVVELVNEIAKKERFKFLYDSQNRLFGVEEYDQGKIIKTVKLKDI